MVEEAIETDEWRVADAFQDGRAERFDGGDHWLRWAVLMSD
jgi:hypothetical protein